MVDIKEREAEEIVVIFVNGEPLFGYKLERALELLRNGHAKRVLLVKKIWEREREDGYGDENLL